MLRQVLISLAVLVAAGFAYVYFVPGSAEMLARFGITLPVAAAPGPDGAAAVQPGQRPGGAPGAGGSGRRGARELIVVTAPVGIASINDNLMAIGEGEAAHSVTVMSPAAGTLDELRVKPGDTVKANDIIGQLDSDAEEIAHERATLAFNDADAALKRADELRAANAATTVQLATAQLVANNAELEMRNAKLALDRRSISSPIPGTVGLFQVSPGNAVNAQTIVTTIEDTSHLLISFWVPERYSSAMAIGMPVAASAVALPGAAITGNVVAVDNRIDPASRTLEVVAQVANDDGRLKPGMSFSVTMQFPGEDFPTVDPLAIQWSSDGAYVWKYVDGKVERLLVEIIQRNSDGVLVNGELASGDQVVTQGMQQLTAGATVRLLDDLLAPPAEGDGSGEGRRKREPEAAS